MARSNTAQQSRRDDMPAERKPAQAASLVYPDVAKEYGIEKPLWLALRNMFPSAQENSIVMVYEYCKVRGLDPLKKPVHIVPIYNSEAGAKIDQIMPGIQEMRTTAARTKEYAGQDKVVFGPLIDIPVTNAETAPANVKTIQVPEWAEVTVYRLVQGKRYAFTHTEYFLEAVARERSGRINDMWQKRSRGQLSKCAEAGALRKAFPEELGGEYAAEEMEGREEFIGDVTAVDGGEHGASGIPEPGVVSAVQQVMGADDAGGGEAGEDKAPEPEPKPADKPDAAKEEATKTKPAADAAPPAADPESATGCGLKIDLPDGALKVLKAQMAMRDVSEAQLLAKMGRDIVTSNINEALGLLKMWAA